MLQKKSPQVPGVEPSPTQETIIGAGVRIKGDIQGDSKMEFHGTVEGNVELDGILVIGDSGKIVGDVSAISVFVDGEIKGNVRAKDKVQLSSNSKLMGNIEADKISIHEGALFQGRVDEVPTRGRVQEREAPSETEVREAVYG